jgi:hypothetical protein
VTKLKIFVEDLDRLFVPENLPVTYTKNKNFWGILGLMVIIY